MWLHIFVKCKQSIKSQDNKDLQDSVASQKKTLLSPVGLTYDYPSSNVVEWHSKIKNKEPYQIREFN